MSGKTAAPWEIPYSEATDEPKVWPTLNKEQAERVAKLMKERFVTVAEHGIATSAASGELIKATASIAVTLPAAAVNATVGVLANNHEVEIKGGAGVIYGDFITGSSTIKLVGYQHVILQSDGTNWFILGGEPKREQVYGAEEARTSNVEYEPSATRPTTVAYSMKPGEGVEWLEARIWVGGLVLWSDARSMAGLNLGGIGGSFYVPAGVKYKIKGEKNGGGQLNYTTRYLTL